MTTQGAIRASARVASAALFVAAGLVFVLGVRGGDRVEAACMQPLVEVSPKSARPGANVTISGYGWRHGCNDTVSCPDGGPCASDPDAPPRTGIRLRFSQGLNSETLGVADGDQNGRFTFVATVPVWATKGAASIRADDVVTGFAVAEGGPVVVPAELGAGDPGDPFGPGGLGALGEGGGAGGNGLAKTGTDAAYLVALGLLLIASGATLRHLAHP